MNKSIKSIFIILFFLFSLNSIAQTKYDFSSSGTRSNETNLEFWGKSSDREISVKWNKDIWLSPSSYRIDSISSNGFIKIYDTYKDSVSILIIKPSGKNLIYNYAVNNKTKKISIEKNQWYKSFISQVIYPYFKATFVNRFYRNLDELITVKVGSTFPKFNKLDINGKKISSDDLKNKITIINFWNIYCEPCIKEMPELNEIKNKYNSSNNHSFITFSSSSTKQIKKLFKKKKSLKFDYQHIPNSKDIEELLGFRFNPVSFILDKNGIIVYMKVGYTSENIANMERILEKFSGK